MRKLIPPVAGTILTVAFELSIVKGWFESIPDVVVALLWFIPVVLWIWWLYTHEEVKRRRHVLHAAPMISLAVFVIGGGVLGAAAGALGWWSLKKQHEHQQAEKLPESQPHDAAREMSADAPKKLPSNGTTDKIEATPERHETADKTTAKVGHAKPKEPVKVSPPESDARFHERIDTYLFSLGENGLTSGVNVESLKKGATPFRGFPVTVFAKENDDKIHYRVILNNGPLPVEIVDGEFSFNEPYWDRNFNDVALEIVDEHQKPMLQVIWKTPSHLVINGIFRMQNGAVVIADDKGWRTMKAGDSIRPLFKYPSYKFQGQYVD
jgi:hypothetical protein